MDYTQRITADPHIMLGKPIVKGTRITVELILKGLAEGQGIEDMLQCYPHLTREDILAALAYSAEVIAGEQVIAQ